MARTTTALACRECATGHYVEVMAHGVFHCTNVECDHALTASDIVLDPGETLTTDDDGHVAYLSTGE